MTTVADQYPKTVKKNSSTVHKYIRTVKETTETSRHIL